MIDTAAERCELDSRIHGDDELRYTREMLEQTDSQPQPQSTRKRRQLKSLPKSAKRLISNKIQTLIQKNQQRRTSVPGQLFALRRAREHQMISAAAYNELLEHLAEKEERGLTQK